MARKPLMSREALIGCLVELFYRYGYDGTTLTLITERTGLGRASLYHHFPGGKEDMARAVLEASDRWGEAHVYQVLNGTAPALERLDGFLQNTDAVHHEPTQITPANAFALGAAREIFGPHVELYLWGVLQLLTELLVACGLSPACARRRAWEFRMIWEGALVVCRVIGDLGLYRAMMRQMPRYLLAEENAVGLLPADVVLPVMPQAVGQQLLERFPDASVSRK